MEQIPREKVVEHLQFENPWWEDESAPTQAYGYEERPYLELLYPLIRNREIRRALVLMGPRRVGKTVILHHAIARLLDEDIPPRNICYISVDHPMYNGISIDDLLDLYQEASGTDYRKVPCYVLLDEIQYMREWERYLKSLVDRLDAPKFIVSGSAAAALKLKSTESGAGRFTDFLLPPLTFYEYMKLLKKTDLIDVEEERSGGFVTWTSSRDIGALNECFIDYINFGGYPEVALSKAIQKDPMRYVKSDVIDKVLLRDLPSLYGLTDVQELNALFTTLAYNTGQEVSLETLSKDSAVSKTTIKRYIEYLEAAFLIRVVHRVDKNAKRFKRANFFKVYLTNPALHAALFSPITSEDEEIGHLVETAIFSQWFHSDTDLYYARWPQGGEVDIVHMVGNKPGWAVEVKWSDRFVGRPTDLKALIKFCHQHNLAKAAVTTKTISETKIVQNVELGFKPSSLYCYEVGFNAMHYKLKKTLKGN